MATNPKPMKRDMRFSLLAMEMTLAWAAKCVPGVICILVGYSPPLQRCGPVAHAVLGFGGVVPERSLLPNSESLSLPSNLLFKKGIP